MPAIRARGVSRQITCCTGYTDSDGHRRVVKCVLTMSDLAKMRSMTSAEQLQYQIQKETKVREAKERRELRQLEKWRREAAAAEVAAATTPDPTPAVSSSESHGLGGESVAEKVEGAAEDNKTQPQPAGEVELTAKPAEEVASPEI